MEKKGYMTEAFVEIVKLMYQAPIFSTTASLLLIYLIIEKWKSIFKDRDYKNKEITDKRVEKTEKEFEKRIEKSEQTLKEYINEKIANLKKN